MGVFLFLSFVRSEFINITLSNIAQVLGGRRTVITKFYSTFCPECTDMASAFSEASTMFPEVFFGGIDCPEEEEICEQMEVQSFPLVHLFLPQRRTGIEFEGDHNLPNYVQFLHNKTRFRARPSPMNRLVELNPSTWAKFAESIECGLVLFHTKDCQHCRHLLPQMALMTAIFDGEPHVAVAALDCQRYGKLCRTIGIPDPPEYEEGSPHLKYVANRTWHDWPGPNMTRDLLDLINAQCGTERAVDGLLADHVGTVPAADAIAKAFISAPNKEELIEQVKTIDGADFYVKVMRRFLDKGLERLKQDAVDMKNNLDRVTVSKAALDTMKRRYNVDLKFLPRSGSGGKAAARRHPSANFEQKLSQTSSRSS
jgi:thiol-disulfide isomerase/thioredoxin